MSKVKALLITACEPTKESACFTMNQTYKTIEIEGAPNYSKQLSDMYELIGCDMVEHFTTRVTDNCKVDLWFDEEGKLDQRKSQQYSIPLVRPTGLVYDIIRGNCIITKSNRAGDITSVTDGDIEKVIKYLNQVYTDCGVRYTLTKAE